VRDLDSKNGVLLNGQKTTTSLVVPGDEVQIGNYVLLFDPPDTFDVAGFLNKHNIHEPVISAAAAPVSDDDTGNRLDTSIHFVPESLSQVFFTTAEVEGLSESDCIPLSGQFLSELIRSLRQLTTPVPGDNNDEESGVHQLFLRAAVLALGADRGVIVLKDEGGEALRLGAIMPKDKDVSVNRVVLRSVLREHKGVLCNDAMHDERFLKTETVKKEKIGSLIAYPLVQGESVIGLIYADAQERANAFRREHLLTLHFFSRILLICLRQPAVRH
jgi:hypothetical protein